jgi:hypothetical protein
MIDTLWSPLDWRTISEVDDIDGAIANWCDDRGIVAPVWGSDFGGDWRLEIPAGTSFDHHPDRRTAGALRVSYPCGRSFLLTIDREGRDTYFVVDKELAT